MVFTNIWGSRQFVESRTGGLRLIYCVCPQISVLILELVFFVVVVFVCPLSHLKVLNEALTLRTWFTKIWNKRRKNAKRHRVAFFPAQTLVNQAQRLWALKQSFTAIHIIRIVWINVLIICILIGWAPMQEMLTHTDKKQLTTKTNQEKRRQWMQPVCWC